MEKKLSLVVIVEMIADFVYSTVLLTTADALSIKSRDEKYMICVVSQALH